MKRTILVVVGFLVSFYLAASPTLFQLSIDNNTEPYIGIWYQKTEAESTTYSRAPISSDGKVNFELEISFEQIVRLQYGEKLINVSVKLNDSPRVNFDGINLRNSLVFNGLGTNNNNFMAEYQRLYSRDDKVKYELGYLAYNVAGTVSRQSSSLTADQFFSFQDNQKKEALAFIRDNAGVVDSSILSMYKVTALYDDLVNRITYFVVNQSRLSFIDFLKLQEKHPIPKKIETKYTEKELMESSSYQNYLKANLYYVFMPAQNDSPRVVSPLIYDLAATNFEGRARYFLQSEILCTYINRSGDPTFGQERYPKFYKENPYTKYTEKVETVYGSDLNALTSSPAPLLQAKTAKGQLVTLQDYQGQVVYVSFWASWCKPCLKGFESSKSTRRQLQDLGVVLFNISIDETEEAFLKSLKRQDIIGINALATNLDETKIQYGLSTIPAYYIIDKNGKFAFLSEEKGRNIVAEFEELVRK